MVHVSELALGRVGHPKDVLSVGQAVEVAVLRIEKTADPKRPEKIALSIRALAKDPWQDIEQRIAVGSRVEGRVTRLQPFGAFVELEPGVEGLVHVSELGAGRRVGHPHEVLSPGDRVEATVLGVEGERRRIALSLDEARRPGPAEPAADAGNRPPEEPTPSLGTLGDLLREALEKKR
jgi:small subunit ribosomal protein S1